MADYNFEILLRNLAFANFDGDWNRELQSERNVCRS